MVSTVGHELQLFIQEIEDHPRGGSTNTVLQVGLNLLGVKPNPNESLKRTIDKAFLKLNVNDFTVEELMFLLTIHDNYNALINNNQEFLMHEYMRLLGEVDARIVQDMIGGRAPINSYGKALDYEVDRRNVVKDSFYIYRNNLSNDSIIGEKGVSKVVEYKESLDNAKVLEQQGVDYDSIEEQTGWYNFKVIGEEWMGMLLENCLILNMMLIKL